LSLKYFDEKMEEAGASPAAPAARELFGGGGIIIFIIIVFIIFQFLFSFVIFCFEF